MTPMTKSQALHDSTILKLVCNGLRNIERTQDTFVINLGNKPSSPRNNGHRLMPKRPIKKPLLLTPHFIPNISLFKLNKETLSSIPYHLPWMVSREDSYLCKRLWPRYSPMHRESQPLGTDALVWVWKSNRLKFKASGKTTDSFTGIYRAFIINFSSKRRKTERSWLLVPKNLPGHWLTRQWVEEGSVVLLLCLQRSGELLFVCHRRRLQIKKQHEQRTTSKARTRGSRSWCGRKHEWPWRAGTWCWL